MILEASHRPIAASPESGGFLEAAGQAELAAGRAGSSDWPAGRNDALHIPERSEHLSHLASATLPHGPSLDLKPAQRHGVEATGCPRPLQKESAKKSAVNAGESARGTGFDAERRLGGVGQGNAIHPANCGHRHPILASRVHPTVWAAGTLGTKLPTRRRRSLSA